MSNQDFDENSPEGSKRRRTKTKRYDFNFMDNEEQRYLQHVRLFYIICLIFLALDLYTLLSICEI